MKIIFYCAFLALLMASGDCALGVDVSQLFTTSTYQCIKSNGYQFAIIRGYRQFGGIDPNVVQNLVNAKSAGLTTNIYMFPNRDKVPNVSVDEMMNNISQRLYDTIWIGITRQWAGNSGNCGYIREMMSSISGRGKKVGVLTSEKLWNFVMDDQKNCFQVGKYSQLWYANDDGRPSFSDYHQIGGWQKPVIKQFKIEANVCGALVGQNYHP